MYKSSNPLPESDRRLLVQALNRVLAQGLDLHSHLKVAHWNVKGMHFAALHPLFETFALSLANHNDVVAERAVTLGGKAYGTVRHVAAHAELPDYPQDTSRALDHVTLLAAHISAYLRVLRETRAQAEALSDADTVDVYTAIISEFEKHVWFLQASLEE